MRDEKIEKLLSFAGNEHRYQYCVLVIFLFLWMNCNFMAVVLPYLEREPLIKYNDDNNILHNIYITLFCWIIWKFTMLFIISCF